MIYILSLSFDLYDFETGIIKSGIKFFANGILIFSIIQNHNNMADTLNYDLNHINRGALQWTTTPDTNKQVLPGLIVDSK